MQIVCCQFDLAWENPADNHRRAEETLARAAIEPNALVLLPEMFATGFSMNAAKVSEAPDGPTARFLSTLASRHQIFLLAGVAVRRAGAEFFNEAICFDPAGKEVGHYAKVHPFSLAGEDAHYAAGAESVVWQCGPFTLQPAVCYDLRFPELFRDQTVAPQVIAVIANWPARRQTHWAALLRARAIENQAYVAGVNRCGKDPACEYAGGSAIFDPFGNVLTEAGDGEQIVSASVDPTIVKTYRENFPALRDRRLNLPGR